MRAAAAEKIEQPPVDAGPLAARRKRQAARRPCARPSPTCRRGIRWGGLLLSGAAGLLALATTLWFARYVEIALQRQDWVGWIAFSLLCLVGFSALVLMLREIFGLFRLARLGALRKEVTQALERERCSPASAAPCAI